MPVTIRDVARRLNLSHTTVSRVLSGRADISISETTRQRVEKAAKEMGYSPNRIARALVTGRTHVIAILLAELQAYHAEVVRHLQLPVLQQGYEIIISDIGHEGVNVKRARSFPVDGIITIDEPKYVRELMNAYAGLQTPFVSFGSYQLETIDYVAVDLYTGTAEAMQHLIGCGCKRIGYVVAERTNHTRDARRRAYDMMMQQAGLQPEYYVISEVQGQLTREIVEATIGAYLKTRPCPDAFFCYSDYIAIGTYRALADAGLHVPSDVLLCGCDGIGDAKYLAIPLTTIAQPIATMCELAWKFLETRMRDSTVPLQQVMLKPELIVRDSTRR